jgi:tRNA1(Val) A37 N6-methylase TrmN6
MFSLIPENFFYDPGKTWLDPCCGEGYFAILLYNKLFDCLGGVFPDEKERKQHILHNMIYQIEYNYEHIPHLYSLFGEDANILCCDYLESCNIGTFDFIIGNPPFNVGGKIKTPCLKNTDKKKDGKRVWDSFVRKSVESLKDGGFLLFITPSIWMKKNNYFHEYMTQFNICRLHTLNNTESNYIFHGNAQTPTSYYLLQVSDGDEHGSRVVNVYDETIEKYVEWKKSYGTIPVYAASCFLKCIQKIQAKRENAKRTGEIVKVLSDYTKKTNMPSKKIKFLKEKLEGSFLHQLHMSIRSIKKGNKLDITYSNLPCVFHGIEKLIFTNGYVFHDISGTYGISNRDLYVISGLKREKLIEIGEKLLGGSGVETIFPPFKGMRFRMGYLEKYYFNYIHI